MTGFQRRRTGPYPLELADGGFAIITGRGPDLRAQYEPDWRATRLALEQLLARRRGGEQLHRRLLTGAGNLLDPGGVLMLPVGPGERLGVAHLHAPAGATAPAPTEVVLALGEALRWPIRLPDVDQARELARATQRAAQQKLPWALIQN